MTEDQGAEATPAQIALSILSDLTPTSEQERLACAQIHALLAIAKALEER